ncbi:MAG: Transmembrane osmosensor [Peltula sp. TS41687]|nr:MAG: Transmembrane osmosensor [Peltula sp. TS41687]
MNGGAMDSSAGGRGRGRRRGGQNGRGFSLANIFGDPFALATISIAILAWIIAFVAEIFVNVRATAADSFPNYIWWTTVYVFFCILGVLFVVAFGAIQTYHVAIVGFMAAALVLTSAAVQAFVYSSDPAKEAAAAGHILLAMISIVWIFYFGSTPEAASRSYVDSFALHKDHGHQRNSRPMTDGGYGVGNRPETSISSNHQVPQMYTSAQLNGFETSSPVSGYPGGPIGGGVDHRNSSQPRFGPTVVGGQPLPQSPGSQTLVPGGPGLLSPMGANGSSGGGGIIMPHATTEAGEVSAPTEYPYRAKAIYSYEANPEDANEISFSKHEILEVSDVSGRWWQAKKETGETGIAPSNYLILL